MMKRAYQHELREKKVASYYYKIQQIITRVKLNPLEVDYSSEIESLIRANFKDRGLILQAEREAFMINNKNAG